METATHPKFEVAGRIFYPVQDTTFEQDLYVMDIVKSSGLDEVEVKLDGKNLDKSAEEMVLRAYRTGNLFRLLAGIVVEKDEAWSVEKAEENAGFFRTLSSNQDKKALHGAIIGAVLSFFMSGLGSSEISKMSSMTSAEPENNLENRLSKNRSEGPETSEFGTT